MKEDERGPANIIKEDVNIVKEDVNIIKEDVNILKEDVNIVKEDVNILWFRHGLRFHDNASLHAAADGSGAKILPIYIFDGESTLTKRFHYNRIKFMLECLEDLDNTLQQVGARLYCFKGGAVEVLGKLGKLLNVRKLCFDMDPEAIWKDRDDSVKKWGLDNGVVCVESLGSTLWDGRDIIKANGGKPPLTYAKFCLVTRGLTPPRRPYPSLDLSILPFIELGEYVETEMKIFPSVPTPEDLGKFTEGDVCHKVYKGGESRALKYFHSRMLHEQDAFIRGSFLPNRRNPDILCPPKSLSPDLKFGCISVAKFYWSVMDTYTKINLGTTGTYNIVSQLIWREFFYTQSYNNPNYEKMEGNPICIQIPWYTDDEAFEKFRNGQTGFPFIDAGVRQMKKEGWTHHVVRSALAMFLTRGDLWLNWEKGADLFLEYFIDADWAVNAGNWMYISSSAFEDALSTTKCLNPAVYGQRVDPSGEYIKKYVPELVNFPEKYIYEPSKAPREVQKKAGCIIGEDYPSPIVKHNEVSKRNKKIMMETANKLMKLNHGQEPEHIKPSDASESQLFVTCQQEAESEEPV